MLESQRREMLENMGLKIFQPRFHLPGAKPSVLLLPETSTDVAEPVMPGLNTHSGVQPVVAEMRAGIVSEDVTVETGVANLPATAKPSALFDDIRTVEKADVRSGEKTAVAAIKCRYRLVRVGELMFLLDQPTLEWHEQARCKSFFAEIYFALSHKKPEFWADAQFDWPPFRNFPRANDKAMAQQALQVFLQEYARQPQCKWLLVWGDGVARFLLDQPGVAGETAFMFDMPVLMLDNYQDYWAVPQKKALLWQYLQVVKKSMATNV